MSARIIMVTGGQRSGKSAFAESVALKLAERPTYLATAQIFDDEMQKRVEAHRARRQSRWRNLESPFELTANRFDDGETVLLDCLTLWASNWFFRLGEDTDAALAEMKSQLTQLAERDMTLVIVTNEIGLGGVSENALRRRFTDLQGAINQFVASLADEVYMTVSGIPVKIKPQQNTL